MRRLLFATPLALALMASAPAFAQQTTAEMLATPQARASYAIGLNMGSSMRADGVTIDADVFLRGVKDALANAKPVLTDEQIDAALRQLQSDINTRRVEKMAA